MTSTPDAIGAATIASYVLGSLWYLMLGKTWRAAVGWSEGPISYRPTPFELLIALIGQLAMAVTLTVLITHLEGSSVRVGVVAAFGVWLGFVMPTLATNVVFQRRDRSLILLDGLHWLLVLATQGAVLGLVL